MSGTGSAFILLIIAALTALLGEAAAPVRPAELTFGVMISMGDFQLYPSANKVVGIEAALRDARAADALYGTNVRMVYWNATYFNDPASYVDAKYLVENVGVFGLFAADFYNSIYAWAYAVENGIPMIAPTANHDPMFTSISRNTFFIQPSFEAEAFQVLNYALNSNLHCWHMTVMYFYQVEELANKTRNSIVGFGYPDPLLVSLQPSSPTSNTYDMVSIANKVFGNASLKYRCHIVLDAVDGMTQIVKHFHKDPRFDAEDSYFIVPSVSNRPLHADDDGSTAIYKNVFITQAYADPHDAETFASVKSYQESVARFFATPSWQTTIPSGLAPFVDTTNYNFEAYQAYIDTRFLIEILSRMTSFTRAAMIDTVYRTKMFKIDDIILGPYIDACGNKFSSLPCWCNAGNKLLLTTRVVEGRARIVYDDAIYGESQVAYFTTSLSQCEPSPSQLFPPMNVALLINVANDTTDVLSGPLQDAIHPLAEQVLLNRDGTFLSLIGLVNNQNLITGGLKIRLIPVTRDLSEIAKNATATQELLDQLHLKYGAMVVVSDVVLKSYRNDVPVFVVPGYALREEDPAPGDFSAWPRNTFYMDPALADYIHTLARWMSVNSSRTSDVVLIAGSEGQRVLGVASLHTFQIDPSEQHVLEEFPQPTEIVRLVPRRTNLLVVSQNHIHVIAALFYALNYPTTTVALATSENVLYDAMSFTDPDTNASLARTLRARNVQVAFASASAAWWDGSLNGFVPGLTDPVPFSFQSGMNTAVSVYETANKYGLDDIVGGRQLKYKLADVLYTTQTLSVNSVGFGPFTSQRCVDASALCQCAKGPRKFFVHQVNDWVEGYTATLRAGAAFTVTNEGCSVQYLPLEVPFDWAPVIGSVVGAIALMLLLVAAVVYWVIRSSKRDNSAAPQDSSKPFTVIFTDIQSSTSLWARAAEPMSRAVEQHHSLIRKLIKKHNGYEIKTIGDSFFIAFKKPADAVRLSLDLQLTFFRESWPPEIDATYVALEQERREEEAAHSKQPRLVMPIDLDDYARNWNGIRVRVGINHGKGNVKFDPTLQGFDYYGTLVNTAARVEGVGHGGQVLLTTDALQAWHADAGGAEKAEKAVACVVSDLGPQPLRGLDQEVHLWQLLPKATAGRTFPPLRLDVEAKVEDEEDVELSTARQSATSASKESSAITTESIIQYVDKLAEKLCRRWKGDLGFVQSYRELMENFNFFKVLYSTSTHSYRKDALETLSKKWRVERPKNLPAGLLSDNVRMLQLVFKVKKALDVTTKDKESSKKDDSTSRKDAYAVRRQSTEVMTPNSLLTPNLPGNVTGGSPMIPNSFTRRTGNEEDPLHDVIGSPVSPGMNVTAFADH